MSSKTPIKDRPTSAATLSKASGGKTTPLRDTKTGKGRDEAASKSPALAGHSSKTLSTSDAKSPKSNSKITSYASRHAELKASSEEKGSDHKSRVTPTKNHSSTSPLNTSDAKNSKSSLAHSDVYLGKSSSKLDTSFNSNKKNDRSATPSDQKTGVKSSTPSRLDTSLGRIPKKDVLSANTSPSAAKTLNKISTKESPAATSEISRDASQLKSSQTLDEIRKFMRDNAPEKAISAHHEKERDYLGSYERNKSANDNIRERPAFEYSPKLSQNIDRSIERPPLANEHRAASTENTKYSQYSKNLSSSNLLSSTEHRGSLDENGAVPNQGVRFSQLIREAYREDAQTALNRLKTLEPKVLSDSPSKDKVLADKPKVDSERPLKTDIERPRTEYERPRYEYDRSRLDLERPRADLDRPRTDVERPRSDIDKLRSEYDRPRAEFDRFKYEERSKTESERISSYNYDLNQNSKRIAEIEDEIYNKRPPKSPNTPQRGAAATQAKSSTSIGESSPTVHQTTNPTSCLKNSPKKNSSVEDLYQRYLGDMKNSKSSQDFKQTEEKSVLGSLQESKSQSPSPNSKRRVTWKESVDEGGKDKGNSSKEEAPKEREFDYNRDRLPANAATKTSGDFSYSIIKPIPVPVDRSFTSNNTNESETRQVDSTPVEAPKSYTKSYEEYTNNYKRSSYLDRPATTSEASSDTLKYSKGPEGSSNSSSSFNYAYYRAKYEKNDFENLRESKVKERVSGISEDQKPSYSRELDNNGAVSRLGTSTYQRRSDSTGYSELAKSDNFSRDIQREYKPVDTDQNALKKSSLVRAEENLTASKLESSLSGTKSDISTSMRYSKVQDFLKEYEEKVQMKVSSMLQRATENTSTSQIPPRPQEKTPDTSYSRADDHTGNRSHSSRINTYEIRKDIEESRRIAQKYLNKDGSANKSETLNTYQDEVRRPTDFSRSATEVTDSKYEAGRLTDSRIDTTKPREQSDYKPYLRESAYDYNKYRADRSAPSVQDTSSSKQLTDISDTRSDINPTKTRYTELTVKYNELNEKYKKFTEKYENKLDSSYVYRDYYLKDNKPTETSTLSNVQAPSSQSADKQSTTQTSQSRLDDEYIQRRKYDNPYNRDYQPRFVSMSLNDSAYKERVNNAKSQIAEIGAPVAVAESHVRNKSAINLPSEKKESQNILIVDGSSKADSDAKKPPQPQKNLEDYNSVSNQGTLTTQNLQTKPLLNENRNPLGEATGLYNKSAGSNYSSPKLNKELGSNNETINLELKPLATEYNVRELKKSSADVSKSTTSALSNSQVFENLRNSRVALY